MAAAKKPAKSPPKRKGPDPAALAMLIQMMIARNQAAQGAGPMAGPPPPWRAGRPPSISPSGSPPLLGP